MEKALEELINFRNERDWDQFHNPKDLAIAISIESGELLEEFLWKKFEDANLENIKKELADIFAYSLLLAHKYNLDPEQIVLEKIRENKIKYPVDKSKGSAKKYNQL